MKRFLAALLLLLFLFVSISASSASAKTVSLAVSGQYIKRVNSVTAYFGNLKGVKSVSYTLMYEGNGIGQGAMGSFSPGKKSSISKTIYLGTCSGKVCTPQRNIKNIQLEVVATLSNGKSSSKTIKIK